MSPPKSRPVRRSACPISFSLDLFGDKWTLLVIRDLMFFGKRQYGEFLQSAEGIATNILADRLSRLEDAGIVRKAPHPEARGKQVYALTDKGLDLCPVMLELIVWGTRYGAKTGAPMQFAQRVLKDRAAVIAEIRRKHGEPS
jgi:DNA-binding HxlR family transcriptional regulator